jgi:hypothetical protein
MFRSLAGASLLSFFVLAASAQAADVTFWACQQAPCAKSGSTVLIEAPGELVSVTLDRRAAGPYVAKTGDQEIEHLDAGGTLDGVLADAPASGRTLELTGDDFELRAAGLTVSDPTPPRFTAATVPGQARGTASIPVTVSDDVGLAQVAVTVDGTPAAAATFGTCSELSPENATSDRALGACPTREAATVALDTTRFADGDHVLVLEATDAAGWITALPPVTVTFENARPTVQAPHDRTPGPLPLGEIGILGDEQTNHTTKDFFRLPARPRVSKAGTLTLTARCPLAKTCPLRVKLTRAGKTLASGRVTVKPKGTAKLTLKLTKAARASLKRTSPQTVKLTVAGYSGVNLKLR